MTLPSVMAEGSVVSIARQVRVRGFDKVYPIANEDLDRRGPDKTASVHFMRFELTPAMCVAAGTGAGIDHPAYRVEVEVPDSVRASLAVDLS